MAKTYFTTDHEWLRVEDGVATVGITDYAQEQLGDLVFVELPETGRKLSKGDTAVVVESVKAASDVYAPVDGEITEANGKLSKYLVQSAMVAYDVDKHLKLQLNVDNLMDKAYVERVRQVLGQESRSSAIEYGDGRSAMLSATYKF